ncbi:MAG: Type II secretion system protein G [Microgenomates group bacterium GW2011_GWA2_46_16]|nr:MAG: Type II secretion system protein G [Microgenomates group bacterium GW2011_GWA2_46_16]
MKKGFTLIELLVVSTIIATLIGIASVSYIRATQSSRDAKRKTDLEQIRQALETYRSEIGTYPASKDSLDPDYISAVPTDPKTGTYQYTRTTTTTFSICAYLEVVPTGYTKPSACTMSCTAGTCNYGVTNP